MSLEQCEDFICPYCGQMNQLSIDMTAGAYQEFVVDCEVCCAPISVRVKAQGGQIDAVDIRRENE